MKEQYLITEEELNEKGLVIREYALDESYIHSIILQANDLLNTFVLKHNHDFEGEEDIVADLVAHPQKISSYKKAQHRLIYNMIFLGDNDPLDKIVSDIIIYDLRWGKLNGFQKGANQW